MAKRGPPFKYDRKAIMLELLSEMSKGDRCMEAIVEQAKHFPGLTTIWEWKDEDPELADILLRAQELWCRAQMRKTIEIADDQSRDILEVQESYVNKKGELKTYIKTTSDNTAVNRDRLRIGARQWAMARLAPKIFGDKLQQEIAGKDGERLNIQVTVSEKRENNKS